MERYSQYRDKGSGIAPFLPVPTHPSGVYLPLHVFLFCLRVPILLAAILTYLLLFSCMPFPSVVKKAALWLILAIPGIWWIDLRIDGVRRGDLGRQIQRRLPQPGSIIVSSFTSPIDALYLAAIFDPVFTASFPNSRLVQHISLSQAIFRAFLPPQLTPPPDAELIELEALRRNHPDQPIVVMPECTTTNGRGIMPLSPCLLSAPPDAKIFPTNLRYTPADVTTPVPFTYLTFLWVLCSKPTHTIRVRIAEYVYNETSTSYATSSVSKNVSSKPEVRNTYSTNFLDSFQASELESTTTLVDSDNDDDYDAGLEPEEAKLLDKVGEALARLGRVKMVALTVADKISFIKLWTKKR